MKLLDQLTNPALLDWFNRLSAAWSSQKPASPTPAPNASIPADPTAPVSPPKSQSETGEALLALLDLLAKAHE